MASEDRDTDALAEMARAEFDMDCAIERAVEAERRRAASICVQMARETNWEAIRGLVDFGDSMGWAHGINLRDNLMDAARSIMGKEE